MGELEDLRMQNKTMDSFFNLRILTSSYLLIIPMNWHPIPEINAREVSEAAAGKLFHVKVKGKKLAVTYWGDRWRAFDARCPHAGGPLHAGKINGQGQIVCPLHRFAFDLESGKCDSGGYFIEIYECKEERFELFVKLPKKKFLGLF